MEVGGGNLNGMSNIPTKMSTISWKQLHEYRDRVLANAYAANSDLATRDIRHLSTMLSRRKEKGGPAKAIEELNTLIQLISKHAPVIEEVDTGAPEMTPAEQLAEMSTRMQYHNEGKKRSGRFWSTCRNSRHLTRCIQHIIRLTERSYLSPD